MKVFHGNVKDWCRVCQSSAGNKINTDLTDLLNIFFCNITRAFGLCSAIDQLNCLFHHFRCHIIQHDDIRTSFYSLFYLFQCLYFNLNLSDKRCIRFCHLYRFGYASGCPDVVIFQ